MKLNTHPFVLLMFGRSGAVPPVNLFAFEALMRLHYVSLIF